MNILIGLLKQSCRTTLSMLGYFALTDSLKIFYDLLSFKFFEQNTTLGSIDEQCVTWVTMKLMFHFIEIHSNDGSHGKCERILQQRYGFILWATESKPIFS